MKKILSTIFLILLISACIQTQLSISYFYTSETSYQEIKIDNSVLTYTYFNDGKCENWVKQTPCWTEADLKIKKAILSEKEIADLTSLIEQVNFFELKDTYGNAEEGQRYYTYGLSVKIGDKEKQIIYKSFPDSQMPDAFRKVKEKLFEIVEKI